MLNAIYIKLAGILFGMIPIYPPIILWMICPVRTRFFPRSCRRSSMEKLLEEVLPTARGWWIQTRGSIYGLQNALHIYNQYMPNCVKTYCMIVRRHLWWQLIVLGMSCCVMLCGVNWIPCKWQYELPWATTFTMRSFLLNNEIGRNNNSNNEFIIATMI